MTISTLVLVLQIIVASIAALHLDIALCQLTFAQVKIVLAIA